MMEKQRDNITELNINIAMFDKCESELSHGEWKLEKKKKNITIYMKYHKDTPTVSMLTKVSIDLPLQEMLAILSEIDLYKKWTPFLSHSDIRIHIRRASRIMYARMWFPVMSDRDVYMYGEAIDNLDSDGSITILSQDYRESKELQSIYNLDQPKTNCVPITVHYYSMKMRIIDKNKTEFTLLANVNPNLKVFPTKLLNWITRKFSTHYFNKMFHHAKNFKGSIWEQRMNSPECKDYYEWVDRRIKEYLSTKHID